VQRKHDLVDALGDVAREAGLSLTHLAMAFSHEHPAVTATIIGPRTMEQLDDLLASADVRLDTATLDAIDALVPPGVNIDNESDSGWIAPWITNSALRRR
jgi:aryl-alcohol dehydrogenase-like predicted oxidoreductase